MKSYVVLQAFIPILVTSGRHFQSNYIQMIQKITKSRLAAFFLCCLNGELWMIRFDAISPTSINRLPPSWFLSFPLLLQDFPLFSPSKILAKIMSLGSYPTAWNMVSTRCCFNLWMGFFVIQRDVTWGHPTCNSELLTSRWGVTCGECLYLNIWTKLDFPLRGYDSRRLISFSCLLLYSTLYR